tara:strand:- start:874 stop:1332 length:459 start_codon:yes stop_codon:yes gene_type:complete
MAVSRGAGTEIIRSAYFEDVVGTSNVNLIVGEQHHIYTLLSAHFYVQQVNTADSDYLQMSLQGYDSYAGTTDEYIKIMKWVIPTAGATFVWNDKTSFNGFEPTDFAGPMDDATKQNAIADQGSSVAQKLILYVSHGSTQIDCSVTFIDQNNA